MATNRHRRTTTYSTYGSVAYAPAYEDGNTVRVPRREKELQRGPEPKRPVRRHERARVQVRQAGQVAPFAVVGFLAVVSNGATDAYIQDVIVLSGKGRRHGTDEPGHCPQSGP